MLKNNWVSPFRYSDVGSSVVGVLHILPFDNASCFELYGKLM